MKSVILAFSWFNRIIAVYPDNARTYGKIGDCYCYGYGVAKNQDTALRYYKIAWNKGDSISGPDIGWIYAFGDAAEHNELEACKWFQRSADKGVPQGKYYMGFFYDKGYGGLPVSKKLAYKYLREAAEDSNTAAIRYLFREKELCQSEKEWLEVKEKFISIANAGDNSAQYDLGISYKYGFGVDVDVELAKKWLEESANNGYLQAKLELAKAYCDYDSGFGVDFDKGFEYLMECADSGISDAYHELYRYYKWSYSFGRTPTEDDEKNALIWAIRSVESGSTYLANEIADSYMNGIGTAVDYQAAAHYYRIALQDRECGMYYLPLAKCYLNGNLLDTNYKDVHTYLSLAMEYANENEYFAEKKGEIEYWIADMYENGLGFEVNLEEAYKHYLRSSEYGYEGADERIKHFKKGLFGWKII